MTDQTRPANETFREKVRDFLGEPTLQCPVRTPVWTTTPLSLGLGVLAVEVAAQMWDLPLVGHNVVLAGIYGALLGLVALLATSGAAKTEHAHCDTCKVCSAAMGVPVTRRWKTQRANLTVAGWVLDEDTTTCPGCVSEGHAPGGAT